MFEVNGVMVNHAGEPVDQDGRVIKAVQPVAVESPDAQALREARADLEGARQESARLTAQLAEADQLAARVVELEAQLAEVQKPVATDPPPAKPSKK